MTSLRPPVTLLVAAALGCTLLMGGPIGPAEAAGCVPGSWSVTTPDNSKPVRYESQHFALRWDGEAVSASQAAAGAAILERTWSHFMGPVAWTEPYCDTATKFKANVNLDPTWGLYGGGTGVRDMAMWMGTGALADRWGLAHEFTHALQYHSLGLRDSPNTGWFWESHAQWMAHQIPENSTNTNCSDLLVDNPHLYYGSTRNRYCNWQFWEYVKNRFGYSAVAQIWATAPKPGQAGQSTADPMSVFAASRGLSASGLNDLFGNWAMRNVTWDYTSPDGSDHGAVFRANYGPNTKTSGNSTHRMTRLDPIDLGRRAFTVPPTWAPQRWGYNLVGLHPDAGAAQFTVTFRGVVQNAPARASLGGYLNEPSTVPAPASGWRWGVVSVGADGRPRYSAMRKTMRGKLTVTVRTGDRSHWLVVVGAPTSIQQVRWDQPAYSVYRFPWTVRLSGAMPDGFQPGAPNPSPAGRRHSNGGGWVADGASVAASAYVGPYAAVLGGTVSGNARIQEHAVIRSGTVSGNAVVGALSVIEGDTLVTDSAQVHTTFLGIGAFERGIRLTGTAQFRGDVEARGASASRGVFYGFIDSGVVADPRQGADRTAAEQEVTAPFTPIWGTAR